MPKIPLNPASLTLSIIIVSYNTQDLTEAAILSTAKQIETDPNLTNSSEIIVIDNNSADESVTAIKKLRSNYPFIKLYENEDNLGFAQANNLGITHSQGEFILLLNSDTKLKPNCLSQLITTFNHHPVDNTTATLSSEKGRLDKLGILAARLLNPDESIQPQGGDTPTLVSVGAQMLFLDDLPVIKRLIPSTQHTGQAARIRALAKHPFQKDWVGGTAMMLRRSMIDEIGLLDPNIFMYGEDIELCMRAKHHHWDIAVDPQAKVIHYGSASSNAANALLGEVKAYIYIWAKHKPFWQMFILKTVLWFGILLRFIIYSTIGSNQAKARVYKQALSLIK